MSDFPNRELNLTGFDEAEKHSTSTAVDLCPILVGLWADARGIGICVYLANWSVVTCTLVYG